LPKVFRPDDREIIVLAVDILLGQVDLARIQPASAPNILAREILDLVNLILHRESGRQMLHSGKSASSTINGAFKSPHGCPSKYPPIIFPYSGQLVNVIVAL